MSDDQLLRELHKERARKRAHTRYSFQAHDASPCDHSIQQILDEASDRGLIEEAALNLGGAS
jgi:hypothetical protein